MSVMELASACCALPETLGNAGFVCTIPGRYTPQSLETPMAREVAAWVAGHGSGGGDSSG